MIGQARPADGRPTAARATAPPARAHPVGAHAAPDRTATQPRGDEDELYRRQHRDLTAPSVARVTAPRELIEDACQIAWTKLLALSPSARRSSPGSRRRPPRGLPALAHRASRVAPRAPRTRTSTTGKRSSPIPNARRRPSRPSKPCAPSPHCPSANASTSRSRSPATATRRSARTHLVAPSPTSTSRSSRHESGCARSAPGPRGQERRPALFHST